tara:strand:+ start:42180 stop:42410 length:231 start_codon:yes stop_codon:yes gene_type:complete
MVNYGWWIKMSFDLNKEVNAIQNTFSRELDQALYGPIGIFSNPVRFGFYALALGVANLLIIQTISGAISAARDEDV